MGTQVFNDATKLLSCRAFVHPPIQYSTPLTICPSPSLPSPSLFLPFLLFLFLPSPSFFLPLPPSLPLPSPFHSLPPSLLPPLFPSSPPSFLPSLPTHSSHPYIFFNQDGMSITFVGFMVTRNGDLIDPVHHQKILERGIMTRQLYKGLKANKVNFEEDYQKWQKGTMIEKIATVMGVEFPYDPDESYVLTVDNLIKILAIQMRFRSVVCCLYFQLHACLSACMPSNRL